MPSSINICTILYFDSNLLGIILSSFQPDGIPATHANEFIILYFCLTLLPYGPSTVMVVMHGNPAWIPDFISLRNMRRAEISRVPSREAETSREHSTSAHRIVSPWRSLLRAIQQSGPRVVHTTGWYFPHEFFISRALPEPGLVVGLTVRPAECSV